MAARVGCAFWPNDPVVNPSLPNLPYISQIRCESIFNGVKVVSLNDFDPVKRRDDGCERDGDHCDHCDDGDGFALSRIVFLRGWPHCWFLSSCAALILDKCCEYAKNTSEKRFTGGNSADYFAVKGICLLLRCWARQVCMVFMLEG